MTDAVESYTNDDDLPGAPGASMCKALKEAAVLRVAGQTWDQIAEAMGRSHSAVSKWPRKFHQRWTHYTQQAEQRRAAALQQQLTDLEERLTLGVLEGGSEAVTVLRSLMQGNLPKDKNGETGETAKGGAYVVPVQVRESAAHSLLAAVQKLLAERGRQLTGVPLPVVDDYLRRQMEMVLTFVPEDMRAELQRAMLELPFRPLER